MSLGTIGEGLQILGLLVASYGLWRTWQAFAPSGERLFEPVSRPIRALVRLVTRGRVRLGRLVGYRPTVTVGAGGAGGSGTAFDANALVNYSPLSPEMDRAEAIRVLDARSRELVNKVSEVDGKVLDETKRAKGQEAVIESRLDAAVDALEGRDARIATEGIRTEALGLFLVGLGQILQWIGPAPGPPAGGGP